MAAKFDSLKLCKMFRNEVDGKVWWNGRIPGLNLSLVLFEDEGYTHGKRTMTLKVVNSKDLEGQEE